MVPVGAMCHSAVPAGRPARLQRPERRPAGSGRIGRRRGQLRRGPGDAGRPGVPEVAVSENQQTVAAGESTEPGHKPGVYVCLRAIVWEGNLKISPSYSTPDKVKIKQKLNFSFSLLDRVENKFTKKINLN